MTQAACLPQAEFAVSSREEGKVPLGWWSAETLPLALIVRCLGPEIECFILAQYLSCLPSRRLPTCCCCSFGPSWQLQQATTRSAIHTVQLDNLLAVVCMHAWTACMGACFGRVLSGHQQNILQRWQKGSALDAKSEGHQGLC